MSTLLAASGGLSGYFAWKESSAAQAALLSEKARLVALRIAQFNVDIEQSLRGVDTAMAHDGMSDLAELRIELIQLLRRVPAVTDLRWVDASGHERIFVSRLELDALNSGRDYAADPRYLGARAGGRFAGPVYFRKGTEPFLPLALASPTPDGGVLLAEVNLTFVSDVVSRERVGKSGIAYVLDSKAQLVSHSDVSQVLARTDLTGLAQLRAAQTHGAPDTDSVVLTTNVQGTSVLSAAVPIEGLGWIAFAEQPAREALAPVYHGLARTFVLVLLGIGISIIASVALARRMVHPIRALERGASDLGAGRWEQRINVRTGDELELLGEQFNRMAARLQETYATLESRIAERTRELMLANEAKTRFLAAASHDLHQPMHALALFLGQLRLDAAPIPRIAASVQRVAACVESLQQLLDALLDMSRLDTDTIVPHREAFPLNPLLELLGTQFTPAAAAKDIALIVHPCSLWIESDPRLLQRILLNFVANAVRYTREGRIVIGCRRRARHVQIVVADTGVGIAAEHVPLIFREFYQAQDPDRNRSDGLGLGLSIVERLARLLGHRVEVRSRPGAGSEFSIHIPLAQAADMPQSDCSQAEICTSELSGVRVLLVDDDPAACEAMASLLRRWGCQVAVAAGAPEAQTAVAAGVPEVIVCDLHLGTEANGFELLDCLRASCSTAPAGIVITGAMTPECIEQGQLHGYPVLGKPTSPAKVRSALEQLVRERATG